MTQGFWRFDWSELDGPCGIRVDVHPWRPEERVPPFVLDAGVARHATFEGTQFSVYGITLNDLTKHQLAIVYRHLIDQTSAPTNLYRTRAGELGMKTADLRLEVRRSSSPIHRIDAQQEPP